MKKRRKIEGGVARLKIVRRVEEIGTGPGRRHLIKARIMNYVERGNIRSIYDQSS